MKTDKFNNMIESFACDFDLAIQGEHKLTELQDRIDNITDNTDYSFMRDIHLLCELDWMLRNGKAEIHIIE